MCRTFQCLRADFFAFRFVSDLRARQYIEPIEQIFTDRSSETKWPLGSKRNAPLKRAGKPPEGSRRNLRDTGGEKIAGRSGMASGKKTFARRRVLRSCPQSGDRAAAAGCPRARKPAALHSEQARSAERAFRVCPVPGDASEDLDIFRQAGEGVQVRDRDDVVSAKVEHHSAVRDRRVG